MNKNNPYAVVIGAANADIGGIPYKTPVAGDSNPGRVSISMGGVGRNIAHNLSQLGVNTELITVLGEDEHGDNIIDSCNDLGIGLVGTSKIHDARTSVYMFITDEKGDMALAVNDMEIYSRISPEFLMKRSELIDNAELVIFDTNIPEESIAWLCENSRAPLMTDPVSTIKGEKLRGHLDRLHIIKPNRIEAEMLTGITINSPQNAVAASKALVDMGVKNVYISLGKDGLCAGNKNGYHLFPPLKASIKNATGAGDAMSSAIAWGFMNAMDMGETALLAQAAAVMALEDEETINRSLSPEALRLRIKGAPQLEL